MAEVIKPRAEIWGQRVAALWYLGAVVAVGICWFAEIGPYAWVASWQAEHLGNVNVTLAALPALLAFMAPIYVVGWLPKRLNWPFADGVRNVTSSKQRPAQKQALDMTARQSATGVRIMAVLTIASMVATWAAVTWALWPTNPPPGAPLPEMTLAAALRPGAVLRSPVRLTEAEVRPGASWTLAVTAKNSTSRDIYLPLVGPGWQPGNPVAAIEVVYQGKYLVQPIPIEGTLARGGIPAWQLAAMREHGIAVNDVPLVLTRHNYRGVVPSPDLVLPILTGGIFVLIFGILTVSIWWTGFKKNRA